MLITPAYAQAAGGQGDMFSMFLPLILIFGVFYFLLIRPQQKRAKEHKSMLEAVRRGDVIVTNGGLIGKIVKVKDDVLVVDLAENVRVEVVRGMVQDVRSKTEPAAEAKKAEAEGAKESGGLLGKLGLKK